MAYLVSFFKLEFYGPGDIIMEVITHHRIEMNFPKAFVCILRISENENVEFSSQVEDRSDEMYFIGEGCLDVYVPLDPQDAPPTVTSPLPRPPGRPQNAWGLMSPGQTRSSEDAPPSNRDHMTSIRNSIKRTVTFGHKAKQIFTNDHIKMGELRVGSSLGRSISFDAHLILRFGTGFVLGFGVYPKP